MASSHLLVTWVSIQVTEATDQDLRACSWVRLDCSLATDLLLDLAWEYTDLDSFPDLQAIRAEETRQDCSQERSHRWD